MGSQMSANKALSIVLILVSTSPGVFAQGVGALTGVVTDPSGAVVPGALVKLTNTGTLVPSNATTNGAGVYNLPGQPIGTYELRVESSGFKTHLRTNVVLETGQTARVDVTLEVGATQESVRITSDAPL